MSERDTYKQICFTTDHKLLAREIVVAGDRITLLSINFCQKNSYSMYPESNPVIPNSQKNYLLSPFMKLNRYTSMCTPEVNEYITNVSRCIYNFVEKKMVERGDIKELEALLNSKHIVNIVRDFIYANLPPKPRFRRSKDDYRLLRNPKKYNIFFQLTQTDLLFRFKIEDENDDDYQARLQRFLQGLYQFTYDKELVIIALQEINDLEIFSQFVDEELPGFQIVEQRASSSSVLLIKGVSVDEVDLDTLCSTMYPQPKEEEGGVYTKNVKYKIRHKGTNIDLYNFHVGYNPSVANYPWNVLETATFDVSKPIIIMGDFNTKSLPLETINAEVVFRVLGARTPGIKDPTYDFILTSDNIAITDRYDDLMQSPLSFL